MQYIFKINKKDFTYSIKDIDRSSFGGVLVFSYGFTKKELNNIIKNYHDNKIGYFFNNCKRARFVCFLFDKKKEKFYAFNDKFGTNEIFIAQSSHGLIVSSDVKLIFDSEKIKPEINSNSVYELLSFYTIVPPKTIYEGITALPMASYLSYGVDKKSEVLVKKYWNTEALFTKKEKNYSKLIKDIRNEMFSNLESENSDGLAMSLSGGVDSGGLLGILTEIRKRKGGLPVSSITMGPYGANSYDLISARKSVKYSKSINHEIYPEIRDLIKMKKYLKNLNQPIIGDLVFPNCLILDKAKELSVDKVVYGSGAEMILGNLKISRISYYLTKIELFLPVFVRKIIYRILGFLINLTKNQIEFLLSKSWSMRFLHARGPLFSREKNYFKLLPNNFLETFEKEIDEVFVLKNTDMLDKIVMVYLFGWVNYLQLRDFNSMTKNYDIIPVMPFDTPKVSGALFKTSNKFRKLSKWNKQVIRDVFKPYITSDLYKKEARSLIVPYSKWFEDDYSLFIDYLKTSSLIKRVIDLDNYEKDFNLLPEPGLSLMRLVSLALWYDINWNKDNVKNYDRIFMRINKSVRH